MMLSTIRVTGRLDDDGRKFLTPEIKLLKFSEMPACWSRSPNRLEIDEIPFHSWSAPDGS